MPSDTTHFGILGNLISQIPSDYFVNKPDLYYIDMGQNLITDIAGCAFSEVPDIRVIMLDENKLPVIKKNMFAGLPNLEVRVFHLKSGINFVLKNLYPALYLSAA